MKFVAQRLEDIVTSLRSLQVDWRDDVAQRVIARIEALPIKDRYAAEDIRALFFADGLTWRRRQSDLAKIVKYQNNGAIGRIYTYSMADRFESDLRQLKAEYGL